MRRPRTFRQQMARAGRRVGVLWSSLALAALVLSWLPMTMRYTG